MSALEAIFLTCLLLSMCYVKWVICRFTCTVFELLLDKADSTLFHKVAADSRPVLHQLYRHFRRPHRTIVCVIELISSACQTTQDALWIVTFLLGPCSRMFINFVLSPLFNSLNTTFHIVNLHYVSFSSNSCLYRIVLYGSVDCWMHGHEVIYTVGHKKRAPKLLPITLAVIDRFWQNLHCRDRN